MTCLFIFHPKEEQYPSKPKRGAGPVIPVPLGRGLMMVGKNILSTGNSPPERYENGFFEKRDHKGAWNL